MKPMWIVFLQALVVALLTIVGMVLLQSRAADVVAPLCGLGAAIWCFFGISYWIRRRRARLPRSRHRAARDQVMLICLAVGLGAPTVLALLDLLIGPLSLLKPPLKGGEAVILTLSVCAAPASILVSSSIDWYLIRAFRDGVFGDPACQADHRISGKAHDYVRYWVMHRFVSEGIVFIAIIGAVAEIAAIAGNATHSHSAQNALNLVGLVGIIAWAYASLAKLKPAIAFLRFPTDCALGAWQIGRNDGGLDIAGLCLDVSLDPGIQLINEPRGYLAPDISEPEWSIPLQMRKTVKRVDPSPKEICPGLHCAFWIQHCEVGNRLKEAELPAPDQ